MTDAAPSMDAKLAVRLRGLRLARHMTLDALAERTGVSRSMISLIERGQSSPTANLLEKLAAGLGMPLAAFFVDEPRADASPLARRVDQPAWQDPRSGCLRRSLSPRGFPSPLELVEVELPPGGRVTLDNHVGTPAIDQQVWLIDGTLRLTVGGVTHELAAGDCLAMLLDRPVGFHNPTASPARYVLAIAAPRRAGFA